MPDFSQENEQLKRCPFCGGKAMIHQPFDDRQYYYVMCTSCYNLTACSTNLEILINAWNRRYDADERLIAHATEMYELLRSVLNADNDNLDPDLIGDIMYCLKEIDGRW